MWAKSIKLKELPDASSCYSLQWCHELGQVGWGQAEGPVEGQRDPFSPSAQTSTTWPSLIKTLCFQEAQLNAYCFLKAKWVIMKSHSFLHRFIHYTNIDWTPTVSHWLCCMLKTHNLGSRRTLGLQKETDNNKVWWELKVESVGCENIWASVQDKVECGLEAEAEKSSEQDGI